MWILRTWTFRNGEWSSDFEEFNTREEAILNRNLYKVIFNGSCIKRVYDIYERRESKRMIYDLIVCWNDGLKDTFSFTSEEAALNAEKGFKKAFGDQVIFTGINKRSISF